jgi:heme/copper-type cytochrome/quinol oxidase subunit 4
VPEASGNWSSGTFGKTMRHFVLASILFVFLAYLGFSFRRCREYIDWLSFYIPPDIFFHYADHGWIEHYIAGFGLPLFFTLFLFLIFTANKMSFRFQRHIVFAISVSLTLSLSVYWELFYQHGRTAWQIYFDLLGIMTFSIMFYLLRFPNFYLSPKE